MKELLSILFLLGACNFQANCCDNYEDDDCMIYIDDDDCYYFSSDLMLAMLEYPLVYHGDDELDLEEKLKYVKNELTKDRFKRLYEYCCGRQLDGEITVQDVKDVEKNLWMLLRQVRDVGKADGVYEQVGKYVGRVNIDGLTTTGTGTLVKWENMPKDLIGKVVLTAGHNTDSSINRLKFMADLSISQNDIETHECCYEGSFEAKHKLYDVDKVYDFRGPENKELDVALIILKTPVKDINEQVLTGALIDDSSDDIDKNYGYYSIGYGDPTTLNSYQVLPGWGWNTKKATRISNSCIDSKTYKNIEGLLDKKAVFPIEIYAGPSQSGAPIINAETHKFKGVFTGGINISVPYIFDKIVEKCDQYILEKNRLLVKRHHDGKQETMSYDELVRMILADTVA